MKLNKLCTLMALALFLTPSLLFAKPKAKATNNNDSGKLKIVTTIFPEYDWVKQILGTRVNDVDLTLLLDSGVDLHSYQPTVQDIAKITNADIFIYVGGESNEWVEDVLERAKNKQCIKINLLEVLGDRLKEEEFVEGMQLDDDDDIYDIDDDEDDDDFDDYDEHVWLSLRNAQILCTKITDALCQKDAENAALYRANLTSYNKKLSDLDAEYKAVVNSAKRNTVLFGDRFPFRYLTEDYGLSYYAAFIGCSAESEASFKTVVFLAEKVNELNLPCILQIETGNGKIAKTIIQSSKNKKAKILTLDSMQSVTSKDIKKGVSYYSIMQKNLEVLKTALN